MLNRYCMLNHGIWWHPTVIVKLMASCWPFHSTLDHPLSWMLSDLSDLSAKPSWEMTSSASWLLFTGDMWFDPTIGHNMWMDMDGHNMIKPKWPNLYVCKVYVYMNYYIYIVAIRVLWYGSSTPTCIHIYMYIYIYVYGILQFGTYQKQVARDLDSYPNLVSWKAPSCCPSSTDHFTVDEIPADGSSRQMFDRRFPHFPSTVWPKIFGHRLGSVPSGNFTFCYGRSPFLMGKLTISMVIFHSFLYVYQRVIHV
jgi:hypothetical protein